MTIMDAIGMSLEEFNRHQNEQPFELINGEMVEKMATGKIHSRLVRAFFVLIYLYLEKLQIGEVFQETTFIMPQNATKSDWVKGSRIPDVMVYVGTRMKDYDANRPDYDPDPIALVPDLVIEVLSETDNFEEAEAKAKLYLEDGVQVVWIVDGKGKRVFVHTVHQTRQTVEMGMVLTSSDLLPDFQVDLKQLFEEVV